MNVNKIYNEDYLVGLDKVEDESIDLILTDIPFNISKDNNFKSMKDRTGRNGIDFGQWDKGFDETGLKSLVPKIKKGGSIVLFHSLNCIFSKYTTYTIFIFKFNNCTIRTTFHTVFKIN